MCAGVCVCVTGYSNPARSGKGLPALRSLYVSFCGCHQRLRGDGLFSFNSKLAVLVSEPDVQIKKVRHAHLILVNLPLHISPACQLMWQQPSQTHAFALCTPPPTTHAPLMQSSCFFILQDWQFHESPDSHWQKQNSVIFPKCYNWLALDTWAVCLYFRRMLNMATYDQLWTGPLSCRGFEGH